MPLIPLKYFHKRMRFPEENIRLLGPEFSTQTPESFLTYINSLRQERTKKGKPMKARLVGRIDAKPKKSCPGTYRLMYLDKITSFPFSKEKTFPEKDILFICDILGCSKLELIKFLELKKFKLSS